jgi:group I intron endonuclease
LHIRDDNKHKAAIYCIFNSINGKKYIGSAITNRINTRFRNHCIHGTGSKNLKNAINKYGLNNFYFMILEYYPGIILKENLKKSHIDLINLETKYITDFKPEYNILAYGYSSTGFKHSEVPTGPTKKLMSDNYSEERKIRIGLLNKNKIYSLVPNGPEKLKFKEMGPGAILKRYATQLNLKSRLSKLASKPVILYLKDGITIHSKYSGIRQMAKSFNCCHKTINKYIANQKIFKNIGYVKYDSKI